MNAGLVSITFRSLGADQIVGLVAAAGLQEIEWGGDIHVPPGDAATARRVAGLTREAGLRTAAYGSYYRLGKPAAESGEFEPILESAVALGAPAIRVWAGKQSSADLTPSQRGEIVADALRIADLAQGAGVAICLEYHGHTLTDTPESVSRLLTETAHPNLEFLWQPVTGESVEQNLSRLHDVLPRLRHVHCFHWGPTHADRHPLADGGKDWSRYIEAIRASRKSPSFLLEYVANDALEQFCADAATLQSLLRK